MVAILGHPEELLCDKFLDVVLLSHKTLSVAEVLLCSPLIECSVEVESLELYDNMLFQCRGELEIA